MLHVGGSASLFAQRAHKAARKLGEAAVEADIAEKRLRLIKALSSIPKISPAL